MVPLGAPEGTERREKKWRLPRTAADGKQYLYPRSGDDGKVHCGGKHDREALINPQVFVSMSGQRPTSIQARPVAATPFLSPLFLYPLCNQLYLREAWSGGFQW